MITGVHAIVFSSQELAVHPADGAEFGIYQPKHLSP